MLRIILFAAVVTTCFCQSAEAQLDVVDLFYDFKIEVRQRSSFGKVLFYDNHKPIVHYSQVNRMWRAFPVAAEADAFLAANPSFELLESHSCTIEKGKWLEVDSLGTMEEAMDRRSEIIQRSNFDYEVSIVPVYSPPTTSFNLQLTPAKQSSLPEAILRP